MPAEDKEFGLCALQKVAPFSEHGFKADDIRVTRRVVFVFLMNSGWGGTLDAGLF